MAKKLVQYLGTGRRKSSVARVYLRPGKGTITINDRAFEDYIPSAAVRLDVLQPLELTENVASKKLHMSGTYTRDRAYAAYVIFRVLLLPALPY